MLATKANVVRTAADSQPRYIQGLGIDLSVCLYGEELAEAGRVYVRRGKNCLL